MTDVPLWRREELWKRRGDVVAAEKARMMEDFAYVLEDGVTTLRALEDHEEIGHRVWDGTVYLGKLLEHSRGALPLVDPPATDTSPESARETLHVDFRGATAVELGAGTGITSMLACVLGDGSTRAYATDVPAVVASAEGHFARNGLTGRVLPRVLVWGNDVDVAALLAELAGGSPPPPPADASAGTAAGCAAAAATVAAAAAVPAAPLAPLPEALSSARALRRIDWVVACDLAAPVRCVTPFVRSLLQLMTAACTGRESGGGHTDEAVGEGGGNSTSTVPAAGVAAAAAAAAAAAPLLPCCGGHPLALLCLQDQRDFTGPLLEQLAALPCMRVRRVDASAAHPRFTSPRHAVYVCEYRCGLPPPAARGAAGGGAAGGGSSGTVAPGTAAA